MRWAVNTSLVFGDLSRERRPQAARDAGFTAVGSWWPFDSATPSPVCQVGACEPLRVDAPALARRPRVSQIQRGHRPRPEEDA